MLRKRRERQFKVHYMYDNCEIDLTKVMWLQNYKKLIIGNTFYNVIPELFYGDNMYLNKYGFALVDDSKAEFKYFSRDIVGCNPENRHTPPIKKTDFYRTYFFKGSSIIGEYSTTCHRKFFCAEGGDCNCNYFKEWKIKE